MSSQKKVYLNAKQLEFVQHNAAVGLFLGGRGVGKSSVLAAVQRRRMQPIKAGGLPRAHTALSSSTYGQILTKTAPALIEMWERMGLYENVHFVIGKTPPSDWKTPYNRPTSYKHVISWSGGNCQSLISMDRPDLARGGSYQAIDLDEAAFVPEEHFKRVMIPSLRGSLSKFKRSPIYRQVNLYTSVPWKSKGKWVLKYIDKAIKAPKMYHVTQTTSMDNLAVLGQDFIDLARAELSPLEFAREIMNEYYAVAERRFYHEFDDDRHCQSNTFIYNDENEDGTFEEEFDKPIEVLGRAEYWPYQMIELSFDFGGWFTGLLAFQSDMIDGTPYEYMIDAMGVSEGEAMVSELVANFCAKYSAHAFKFVQVWGEPRGHDRNAVDLSMFSIIEREFAKHGWRCIVKARAVRTALHHTRHEFINKCLKEDAPTYPRLRIIQEECHDAIISIMTAEIKSDGRKDKSPEKDPTQPQQHATHYTDMLDYYLFYKYSAEVGGLLAQHGGGEYDTV